MVSSITMLPLNTKNPKLAHVQSLQRQVYIIPKDGKTDLDVTIKYTIEGYVYTVYASSVMPRCYG